MSEQICIIPDRLPNNLPNREQEYLKEKMYIRKEKTTRIGYLVGAEFKAKWRKKYMF